jgi:hypothetical protein
VRNSRAARRRARCAWRRCLSASTLADEVDSPRCGLWWASPVHPRRRAAPGKKPTRGPRACQRTTETAKACRCDARGDPVDSPGYRRGEGSP